MTSAVALACALFLAGCSWGGGSSGTASESDPPIKPGTGPEMPVIGAATAPADPLSSLYDPIRHMRVSEVRPGMKGFGLSVFRGTKIEKFDVVVLAVLKNFNAQHDVVLIDCHGMNLEHTGSIAGMSGSPVFLRDDSGRDRMIGAFAYGWPLAKDPIAGVQPIEYMLKLPVTRPAPATLPSIGHSTRDSVIGAAATWTVREGRDRADSLFAPPVSSPLLHTSPPVGRSGFSATDLRPLATPLMAAGLPARLAEAAGPLLAPFGMMPVQAGGTALSTSISSPQIAMVPGSVLAVPLLTGDLDLTAIGTCTEVVGNRVFGFGHPFNNEGQIRLPFGGGEIHGVVANLNASFKLGASYPPRGTLTSDESVGIGGLLGDAPAMIPIEVTVRDAEARTEHVFHFQSALHSRFTPMLAGMAVAAAGGGSSELPQYNTVDWTIKMEFANGRTLHLADRGVNLDLAALMQMPAFPIMSAAENPFEPVPLRRLSANLLVSKIVRDGSILQVNLPRAKYRPGETVKAFVTCRPFRGNELIFPVEMELPKDLLPGPYRLVVSDADRFMADEQMNRPFRFMAHRVEELFDAMQESVAARHDAMYIRLIRQNDGIAIGRTALPMLPSSKRQVLLEAGRSDTSAFVSSTTKIIPIDRVISGAADFTITIEQPGHLDGLHSRGPASRPAIPTPRADEPKPPRVGGVDVPAKP